MTIEQTGTLTTTAPDATTVAPGDTVDDQTFQQMLAILNELVSHTHIFYDDYSTACDCNCACDCTRGIV